MVSSADVPAQFVSNWKPYSRAPSGDTSSQSSPKGGSPPATSNKLCLACDECRQARVKCPGGNPCRRCMNNDGYCHYSVSKRSGRTKAIHNKKRQNNNSNSNGNIMSPPPPTMVDNSQKNAVHGNAIDYERSIQKATPDKITTTSIDHSMSLDDFTLLNAMDSSNSSAELSSDSSLRDLFPGAFDSLDFGSIFSSANSSATGIPVDPPFPRPLSASRLSFSGQGLGEPSPNFRFGSPLLAERNYSSTPCSCFKTQLLCISHLCNPMGDEQSRLDTVLETARHISEQMVQLLSCSSCLKGSHSFILTTMLLQRLVCLFCHLEKNGSTILKTTKIKIGTFQLSEEEEQQHKKLLITTAAKKLNIMVNSFYETVRQFQQAELLHQRQRNEEMTEMGRSNLNWVVDAVQKIRRRLKGIIGESGTEGWS